MSEKIKNILYMALKGIGKWYPGQRLPDIESDLYVIDGQIRRREDVAGLKEFDVEPLIKGDRFYIPLPKEIGGDMNEQKYLIGIAKKPISANTIKFGPYISMKFDEENPKVPVMSKCARFLKNMTGKQILTWHDAAKDTPETNRVLLIKVPNRPWIFDGKGDIKQRVAYLDENHEFQEFGPSSFTYSEVTEWAYLDE